MGYQGFCSIDVTLTYHLLASPFWGKEVGENIRLGRQEHSHGCRHNESFTRPSSDVIPASMQAAASEVGLTKNHNAEDQPYCIRLGVDDLSHHPTMLSWCLQARFIAHIAWPVSCETQHSFSGLSQPALLAPAGYQGRMKYHCQRESRFLWTDLVAKLRWQGRQDKVRTRRSPLTRFWRARPANAVACCNVKCIAACQARKRLTHAGWFNAR